MNQRFRKSGQIKTVRILVNKKRRTGSGMLEFVLACKSQLLSVQEFCRLLDVTSLTLALVVLFLKIGEYYIRIFFSEEPVAKYLPINYHTLHIIAYTFHFKF